VVRPSRTSTTAPAYSAQPWQPGFVRR
jgi:hypothetical protein